MFPEHFLNELMILRAIVSSFFLNVEKSNKQIETPMLSCNPPKRPRSSSTSANLESDAIRVEELLNLSSEVVGLAKLAQVVA